MKRWFVIAVGGAALFLLALILLYGRDRILRDGEAIEVPLTNGRSLSATYYPGSQPAGILLLEGFGSDQMAMRAAASEFAQAGVAVMTLDFAGHGRSPGTITFDNAQTDELARQTLAALDVFMARANLLPEQIIILGHSMGARVGLQAMTMNDQPVAGLIMLGGQVNLDNNQQAETFTGVSDSDLAWVQGLSAQQPASDILLITGSWDDILPPHSAELLLVKLQEGEPGSASRELQVVDGLVHNYEIYSSRALGLAKSWAGERWGIPLAATAVTAQWRVVFWLVGILSLYLAVGGAWRWAVQICPTSALTFNLRIVNARRFLWGKLGLWLAAVPLAVLLGGLFFILPLGLLAFNIYYVCLIGGYGLLFLLLYWRGWVPGVNGRLPFVMAQETAVSRKRLFLAIVLAVSLFGLVTSFIQTGLFSPSTGQRFIWLLIYTPFATVGFAIGLREFQLAQQSNLSGRVLAATAVIGLVPFILYTIFLALLGSISGMLGGLQGLLILGLVWLTGGLIQQVGQRLWVTAVFQSVLLFWLVLPVGPMFAL